MKKWLAALFTAALLLCGLSTAVLADQDGPDIFAEGYVVMNLDTGEIILRKNMDERKFPASITKIMTAMVVLEHCGDLQDTITFSETAINSLSANSSTLTPRAVIGEQMTVESVLYGMMLCSSNGCANALAEYTAGSVDAFAGMMNQKAEEIGAVNSHFVNPHGLHDDNHYTTPHDMALIFQAAMRLPVFRKLVSTVNYTIPKTNLNEERPCTNTHRLVNGSIPCEGVYAGKTGNTTEAGRTLVTAASRYGVNLVAVIMKSDNDHFYTDTQILLEYGFGFVSGAYPAVQFQPRDDMVVVAAEGLRLREYPSVNAVTVGSVSKGNQIHRVGVYGGWSKLDDSGRYCYAATDYLTAPDGSALEPPYETREPTYAETTAAPEGTQPAEPASAADEPSEGIETEGEPESETASTEAPDTAVVRGNDSASRVTEVPHTLEVNENTLKILIIAVICVIAVLCGVVAGVLVVKKTRDEG